MKRVVVASCLVSACTLVPMNVSAPGPHAQVPAESAPASVASTPAAPACPTDLAIDPGRTTIATIQAMANGSGGRFASTHKRPLTPAFSLTRDAAIDKVLAIEAMHPALIPAGFRDAVRATPRDAALRVRMSDCEARHSATQRRSAYDLALAFLLGSASVVRPPEVELLVAGQDPSPAQRAFYFISQDELAIEDALTRALYAQRQHLGNDGFIRWAQVFVHSCGGATCNVKDRNNGFGDPDLISWDLRDGGTIHTTDGSRDRKQHEAQCKAHTGSLFLEECETTCQTTGQSGACVTKCEAFCSPHE